MSELQNLHDEEVLEMNDQKADECIRRIREAQDQIAFWKGYYREQMQAVEEANNVIINNNLIMLRAYFETVPHRKTSTQESYRLPSGKLVIKAQEPEYQRDDAQILKHLKQTGGKYIKVSESVDWARLKKSLMVVGDTVADEEGNIIPGITVIDRDPVFSVEK